MEGCALINFVEYPDRDLLAMDLASQLADELNNALHHDDRATLVVPGGTTPGPIFDDLCAADVDWSRVDVSLSDERWVPETSDRSNTKLIKERLLIDRASAAGYLSMYAPFDTPEEGLPSLIGQYETRCPLTVVVLGMGADMHTASIFPGADNLELALSDDAPLLVAMRAPGAPEPGITLAAHALAGALNKHVVIFGDEKRAALEKALMLDPYEAPIKAVLSGATVHWAP